MTIVSRDMLYQKGFRVREQIQKSFTLYLPHIIFDSYQVVQFKPRWAFELPRMLTKSVGSGVPGWLGW